MKKSKSKSSFTYQTDPRCGCAPEARPIREHLEKGVVVLDKPAGPTSHEVVAWVKQILGLSKAAHTGTLDPNVTGVLPVLLGAARKLANCFVGDKEYVCVMKLHGEVGEREGGEKGRGEAGGEAAEAAVRRVCEEFVGRIYQRPPLKSAVKRRVRVRTVHYSEVKEVAGRKEGREVLLRVGCEAGTYIRMLCHHIGLVLGVGAHMSELRRTKAFPFDETGGLTRLQDLKDAFVFYEETGDESLLRKLVVPIEFALRKAGLPSVVVKDSAVDAICHGADLAAPGILQVGEKEGEEGKEEEKEEGKEEGKEEINRGDRVVIYTLKGEAVGVGRAKLGAEEMLKAEKGVCVETERVFMKPGTYKRGWKSRGG